MEGSVAEQSIVIDNGSLNIKAGYSGEDLPRCTFESVVGHDNRKHHDEWFVSSQTQGKEAYLDMKRAVVRGESVSLPLQLVLLQSVLLLPQVLSEQGLATGVTPAK